MVPSENSFENLVPVVRQDDKEDDEGITSLAGGASHSCFSLGEDVFCVGSNQVGQLGDNTEIGPKQTPVKVLGLPNGGKKLVSAGMDISCILTQGTAWGDQSVWCWGLNSEGQLGDATQNNAQNPIQVEGLWEGVLSDCDEVLTMPVLLKITSYGVGERIMRAN